MDYKGAFITSADFGDFSWDEDAAAQEISIEVQPDYCVIELLKYLFLIFPEKRLGFVKSFFYINMYNIYNKLL